MNDADKTKTIDGFAFWIEHEKNGICYVPLNLCKTVLKLLKEQIWHDASVRPPRKGRYLVWGLHEFTPDHCDEPNAYWQTRIAQWSDIYGWDVKVKFWMELPDVPNP